MSKKDIIKRCLFFLLIVICLCLVAFVIKRYDKEGEKELPYQLSKILLISNVDGIKNEDEANLWNINLSQFNDVYINIEKNKNDNSDTTIKSITLENFNVSNKPSKGNLKIYRPTGDMNKLYTYSEENYLNGSLKYVGEKIDDPKNLEISNIGGMMTFRLSLEDLGNYTSNEDTEIVYDGSLLSKVNISLDDIKYDLSFDIIIETSEDVLFKGTVNLNLPAGDIITEGSANTEINDFSNVVFKRVKK